MAKPLDTSKYFTMLKPFEVKPGYYMLSDAVLRSQLELAYMEGVLSEEQNRGSPQPRGTCPSCGLSCT